MNNFLSLIKFVLLNDYYHINRDSLNTFRVLTFELFYFKTLKLTNLN
jgi:hypothetical protein